MGDPPRKGELDDTLDYSADDPIVDLGPGAGAVLGGRWRLSRLIGKGGMGRVYLAEHVSLGTRAAVKLLHPHKLASPDAVERLLREARAAGVANHPGVTEVLDFEVTPEGAPFLVMELLSGKTLEEAMQQPGGLDLEVGLDAVLDVLGTLSALHAAGVVHRDVKPSNIFLVAGEAGRTKLLDFGIARVAAGGTERGLTRTGDIVGTPFYMTPELARGQTKVGPQADLWAVGVLLYELVTGKLPFTGENYNEIIAGILTKEPPPPPERFAGVLRRALAKDPGARYASAAELADAIRQARQPPSPSRRAWVVGAAAASLVLGGGGFYLLRSARKPALRLTWSPYRPAAYLREHTRWLREALGSELDRPVEMVVATSYDDAMERVLRGEVMLAGLSAASYVKARRRDPGLALLARAQSRGADTYQAVLLTRAASPIREIGDLAGKSFCFVDETSTAGYVYPRHMLAQAGVAPGQVTFAHDHQRAVAMVDEGKCDAAGVSASSLTQWAGEAGMSPARFRILAASDPIPGDALVAAPGWADELRPAVERLIARTSAGGGAAALEISGLVRGADRDYDVVRNLTGG